MKHWPEGGAVRHLAIPGGGVVYDASLASNADGQWLDLEWWRSRGLVHPVGAGRGSTYVIDADSRSLVLRHYRRGGLVAKVSRDAYLWRGPAATRSFAEWHLLYLLRQSGLAVPAPVAARFQRQGLRYRADLLTELVPDSLSLAERLTAGALAFERWVTLGRTLFGFHQAGVCHADLNAHNVLIDQRDQFWLIDFDRAKLRAPGLWTDANLARLYRSLDKLRPALAPERFSEQDWSALLSGYFSARSEQQRIATELAEQQRLASLLK